MWMPVTVVLERMATTHDLACELRIPRYALSNAEESSFDAVLVQHAEHLWSDRRFRAIIDRECDALFCGNGGWQARPVWAEQGATRPQSGSGENQVICYDGLERDR